MKKETASNVTLMSLRTSPIGWTGHVAPPARLPNGGLYAGAAATGDWRNVPIEPDAAAHVRFIAQVQPPGAVGQQLPDARPGSAVPMVYRKAVDAGAHPGMYCLTKGG
jgi:hypothetical protein